MPNPNTAVVTILAEPRGPVTQALVKFYPSEVVITNSWGLQPATGMIDWVSAQAQPSIVPMAGVRIEVGGYIFEGICKSAVPVVGSDGNSLMQEFVDAREFLGWDIAYCAFNIRDNRIVNGQYIRRYKHVLPVDYNGRRWTYTTTPYTARQILDFLFEAPTTETDWTRTYHVALNNPVYEIDCLNTPRKLGTVVQEISERLGTVFTIQNDPYNLIWTVKGTGTVPAFPANSNNRRLGQALSGNPSRIRIIGDRNRYQVMDVPMMPDWTSGWATFYDFNAFVDDLFQNESTEAAIGVIAAGTAYKSIADDDDQLIGRQLAAARARTITVGEYAALRNGRGGSAPWKDVRKFNNRSRLQMPVALYLQTILFRAFRFLPNFYVLNTYGQAVDLYSLNLVETGLVEVTHDPITGKMSYTPGVPSQPNGYAIVQGYQVASDAFKTLNPTYFDLTKWKDSQAIWATASFQVDDSGEGDQFIIFEEPVIASGDLLDTVVIDGTVQTWPAIKAGATVSSPNVKVALTFEAENFSYVAGFGAKDDVVNEGGLSGEYVAFASHQPPVELVYGDGQTARAKAASFTAVLLNRQYYYAYGGYQVQGSNATGLTSVIDRVSVRLNAQGLTEDVDFTTERARNVSFSPNGTRFINVEPDREFERKTQLNPLLPGQRELRQEANQLKLAAAFLKQSKKVARELVETFHLLLGMDAPPGTVTVMGATGTLPAGTPLFREQDETRVQQPNNVTADAGTLKFTAPVFEGVTTVNNEPATGPVRVTRTGNGGVILARVKGPVKLNDPVGLKSDQGVRDYLTTSPGVAVGNSLEEWDDDTIRYARVARTGGGGDDWPPEKYDKGKSYGTGKWVLVGPANDVVVTPVDDIDHPGTPIQSDPGLYRAMQPVAPVPDGSGGFKYHIPRAALANLDDPADPANFWYPWPYFGCGG